MAALCEVFWGLGASLVASATVLTILLRRCGADERIIGAIPAVEAAGFLVPQFLGAFIFNSRRKRKWHMVAWHIAAIIPFWGLMGLLAAWAGHWPATAVRWALLGLHAGFFWAMGMGAAAWQDWWAGLFDVRIRGSVTGLVMGSSAVAGVGGALFSGWAIAAWPGFGVYGALYLLAVAMGLLSMVAISLVRDPGQVLPEKDMSLSPRKLLIRVRQSLADRNFRRYLVGRLLASWGFCMIPFIAVYYTSPAGGALGAGQVVSLGAASTLATAVGSLALGRLGDRMGHRLGVLIGVLVQAAALCVLLTVTGRVGCAAAYALAGMAISSGWVSHGNMMLETCPHGSRMAHLTAGNLVVGLGAMIGPLVGGQLAKGWGVRTVFAGCLALSVIAALWVVTMVREPRNAATAQ